MERIEIAVVGAHMEGMALNEELRRLGGEFSRRTHTQPEYRLFALAGGPPARPGLLRVEAHEGQSIEVEVWSLAADAFGHFVAKVPAPLCIGTLRLADGTSPKGFLVEPQGIVGARDITSFGGWRAYVASLVPAG